MNFEDFWTLVANRGRVAHFYREECAALWKTFPPETQRAIYEAIDRKIRAGMFVSFRPTDAIHDNIPQTPKPQIISYDEHYRRYGTDAPQDGFRRVLLKDQQKTIYVKQPT